MKTKAPLTKVQAASLCALPFLVPFFLQYANGDVYTGEWLWPKPADMALDISVSMPAKDKAKTPKESDAKKKDAGGAVDAATAALLLARGVDPLRHGSGSYVGAKGSLVGDWVLGRCNGEAVLTLPGTKCGGCWVWKEGCKAKWEGVLSKEKTRKTTNNDKQKVAVFFSLSLFL